MFRIIKAALHSGTVDVNFTKEKSRCRLLQADTITNALADSREVICRRNVLMTKVATLTEGDASYPKDNTVITTCLALTLNPTAGSRTHNGGAQRMWIYASVCGTLNRPIVTSSL